MAKYDVLDNGVPTALDPTKNYVKNTDGTLSIIADLGTLATNEIGLIGHPTAIHKILLSDRNLTVLDEKKLDVSEIGVSVQAYDGTLEIGATADQNWGDIAGTLSSQTDLQTALNALQPDGVTVLNTTGGTIALTDAEAHYIAFDVKGVLTSNVVVTVPATITSAHMYVIDNATTGAFTCTAQVVGGAGIEVPQGVRYLMYSNGTKMEGITAVGGGGLPASLVINVPQGNISSTDMQSVINELDTEKEPADSTILKDADIGVNVQAYDVILDGTTASYTSAEKTKLGLLPSGYLGYYETEADLIAAHPVGVESEHATIGFTGTTWTWDAGGAVWIDTGNASSGDMLKATYDPTNIIGDTFLRTNHTGTQLLSTISDSGNSAGLDTGTTGSTVALGNHLHTGIYEPLLGFTAVNIAGDTMTGALTINAPGVGDIPLIIRNVNATGFSGSHMYDETDTVIAHNGFINTSRILTYNNLDAAGTIELQLNSVPKLTVETNGNITIDQNIVMNSLKLVDGRDLSVDGAKLDLVEDNADVTDAVNVESAGAVMDADIGVIVSAIAHNHSGTYEPVDVTILKDADIGVSIEAYDTTILKDADIGVTVSAIVHNHTGVYEPLLGFTPLDLTGGTLSGNLTINNVAPQLRFEEADATANNANWMFVADGTNLTIRAYNDAYDSYSNALAINRSGTVVDNVTLAGTNIALNGDVTTTGTFDGVDIAARDAVSVVDADIGVTIAAYNHNHTGVYEPANANIQTHIASTSNPHSVTKTDVGLNLVDNTADANKSVNYATSAGSVGVPAHNGIGSMVVCTTTTTKSIGSNYSGVGNIGASFRGWASAPYMTPYLSFTGTSMPAGTWRCMSLMMTFSLISNYSPNVYKYQYLYMRVA